MPHVCIIYTYEAHWDRTDTTRPIRIQYVTISLTNLKNKQKGCFYTVVWSLYQKRNINLWYIINMLNFRPYSHLCWRLPEGIHQLFHHIQGKDNTTHCTILVVKTRDTMMKLWWLLLSIILLYFMVEIINRSQKA